MMSLPKEYFIPKSTDIVFVSDFFVEDLIGGGELTSEAVIEILKNEGNRVFKLHSASLTDKLVEDNKDKIWLLGNWSQASLEGTTALVRYNTKYYPIEYDFKACLYRSPQLHQIQEKKECNCFQQKQGKFVSAFYSRAQHVFFMSHKQLDIYTSAFPILSLNKDRLSVLSSVWTQIELDYIRSVAIPNLNDRPKKDKWAILSGATWIKAEQETVQYCKQNNIEYELIGGLPYQEFLKELAKYRGLVFRPAGWDTAPRIVIESKIMGLSLCLNENVLHSSESWFLEDNEKTLAYLKDAKDRLLSKLKI